MKKTQVIEIDEVKINELIKRLEANSLEEGDYELIIQLISTVVNVNNELTKKNMSIMRLRRLFNIKTEKRENLTGTNGSGTIDKSLKQKKTENKDKKKNHGRMGADCYKNAERIKIKHETLKVGDECPACLKGKLYDNITDGVFVKITAQEIFKATIYERERLRCNACFKVFEASLPPDVKYEKYDAACGSLLALLKYGAGFPFYRLEQLQNIMEVPLPASTQWDIIKEMSKYVYPVYEQLVFMAAQGKVLHNDDTTMRVLSIQKENETKKNSVRKGIFTTGIVSRLEGGKDIVLYYTGKKHAGENISNLLMNRLHELGPPIQMCDALSRNVPENFETVLANCLIHGRRNFVDIENSFPEECMYVIDALAKVYHNDSIAKKTEMNDEERLSYHQNESGPVMEELKSWLSSMFDEKKVEPNSGLGGAIKYMQNHWEKLTLFLKVPGAPLDNNVCERSLKKAILNRKNAMFYKTKNGAKVGDMFMSVIQTCNLGEINALHYMKILKEYSSAVSKNPSDWLPWNYKKQLSKIEGKI